MTFFLWSLAIALIAVGALGTVVPILPGALIVFLGMLLAAWLDSFERVGPWTLGALALLTVLVYVVDFAGGAVGAQRLGASRRAVWGAALGALIGMFFGLAGILVGPFAGAVLGEYTVQKNVRKAGKAGAGAWVGLALAAAAKVALVFAMLALFVAAYAI